MSMNLIIHAAVRRDIARLGSALDGFPAGSSARAAQLALAWRNLSYQLTHHHEGEEEFFWPALLEVGAPSDLVADRDGEHRRLAAAVSGGDAAFAALEASADPANVAAAREAIRTLGDIVDTHFSHEESELEPILMANLETAPIKAAVKKVQRSQGPVAAGRFMAWLADGACGPEKSALESTIPGPIRFVFGNIVGRGYHAVASVWAA